MKATIASVQPEPSFWSKDEKQAWFVNGRFADNSELSVWNNSEDQAKEVIGVLSALIGKEGEYEVDGKKLKDWPGKPGKKSGAGFGGRNFVSKWTDMEPGARWMDDRINRRRALELAVQEAGPGATETVARADLVMARAKEFYEFLNAGGASIPAAASPAPLTPSGGGAPRPSGGGGPAESPGEGSKPQPPSPTGQNVRATNPNCSHSWIAATAPGWWVCEKCGGWKEAGG
jgi:hypothetical protein